MRLGNVPGMSTEHFLFNFFYQPEQEGESPSEAAATTGSVTDIAGLMEKDFLLLYDNTYSINQHWCMVIQMGTVCFTIHEAD